MLDFTEWVLEDELWLLSSPY